MFTQCVKIKDIVKVKQNVYTMCKDKGYCQSKTECLHSV